MRTALRIVHTSDVHLDTTAFSGERGRSERGHVERAFAEVVETVREERADLFLIAGDLFDSSRVSDAAIEFAMDELGRAPCPVVLLPGNHDCYDQSSIYRRVDFGAAGAHVHTVTSEDGETLEFADHHATVWGRAMVEHDHGYRPLDGAPPRNGDRWHIGMAHGMHSRDRRELRSSLITPDEIAASGFDYLALGHVHVFRDVSSEGTRACYSGSPAPLHAGADAGGSVAIVTLDPRDGVTVSERKIQPHP